VLNWMITSSETNSSFSQTSFGCYNEYNYCLVTSGSKFEERRRETINRFFVTTVCSPRMSRLCFPWVDFRIEPQ
jgi:hypothetical protein